MARLDPYPEGADIASFPRLGRTARLLLMGGAGVVGAVALVHFGVFGGPSARRAMAEPEQHGPRFDASVAQVAEPTPAPVQRPAGPLPPADAPAKPAEKAAAATARAAAAPAKTQKSMDVQVADYRPKAEADVADGRMTNRWPGCALFPGQIIPATLDGLVISEVQGPLGGLVTSDVLAEDDPDPTRPLVPQGSRLVGGYRNTDLGPDRRRLDVYWSHVVRPDGTLVRLGDAAGIDLAGAAGVGGKVVTHWGVWFFNTLALALIGTAEQQGNTSSGTTGSASGSAENATAGAVGQNGRAAVTATLNFRPTIEVKAGTRVAVRMTRLVRAGC